MIEICITLFSTWIAVSFPGSSNIIVKTIIGIIAFFGINTVVQNLLNFAQLDWTLRRLLAVLAGAAFGLLCANMTIFPIYFMIGASDFHRSIGSIICILFAFLFARLFAQYEPKIFQANLIKQATNNSNLIKILDSNVLIDGRISQLIAVRFLEGLIVIPEFVLDEIKHIADDSDEGRKRRGKHALQISKKLIEEYEFVTTYETKSTENVDLSLLELARNLNAKIVTSDSNLIELAAAKNIPTININELSVAFQAVYVRGDKLKVKIVQEGSGPNQGIALSDDGTMIVVPDSKQYLGKTINVVVTRQLQSKYGITIFADLDT